MASSIPQPSSVFCVNSFNGNTLPKPPILFLASDYHSTLRRFTKISSPSAQSQPDSSPSNPLDSSSAENASAGEDKVDPVKLAFAKARAYKQSKANPAQNLIQVGEMRNDGDVDNVPVSVELAMEEARECKTKGKEVTDGVENVVEKQKASGLQEMWDLRETGVEEIAEKKEELTISSIDFLGLDFSDKKKTRGMPAGLVPTVDPFSDGDLPEVELLIGDPTRFEDASLPKAPQIKEDDGSELYEPKVSAWSTPTPNKEDDDSELYKPKVSTWGVFPRPSNISKTFGGGRVIQPGEELETAEAKAAKETRTKHLLAAYKKKMGSTIDAKTKSECQKALNDGDYLMDLGKLKEALPYYEKIMKALVFQSELHGLAALQWSLCQDSLSRPNEAQAMYEKLQSHPNVQVSRKARHLMFGFQAMEMMKVTASSSPKTTGYQMYFEAFVEDKANNFLTEENNEDVLRQALPYIMFLMSPLFIVLYIASRKLV